jgi:hypothetical protein
MNYYDEPNREDRDEQQMTEEEAQELGLTIQTLDELEERNLEE